MSRVGKKIIQIPNEIELKIEGQRVSVSGPKGKLEKTFRPKLKIEAKNNTVSVFPLKESKLVRSLWGTTRVLISNMIKGVSEGFEKQLEIQGIGFKAEVSGQDLILNLGFSHPVKMKIKEGINVSVDKNIIKVSGTDKELVGQFASNVRKKKKPEPYKGKGIRYLGEKVRKKVGKKVAGTTG